MEHIAPTAANHLKSTPFGLQYNYGKFMLEYVSKIIFFKFERDAQFLKYCIS